MKSLPPLTREDIKETLTSRLGLSKREAAEVLESFLETIGESLAEGESVLLTGLGRFEVKERAAKKGRNINTGEEVLIPAFRKPVFTLSRSLRKMLADGQVPGPDFRTFY